MRISNQKRPAGSIVNTFNAMLIIFLFSTGAGNSQPVTLEPYTERYGSDYAGFDLPAADPRLCARACAADNQCAAYGYVIPGVQGPSARCWLKNAVPPAAVGRPCCVSGVKSAQGEMPSSTPDLRNSLDVLGRALLDVYGTSSGGYSTGGTDDGGNAGNARQLWDQQRSNEVEKGLQGD